MAADGPRPRTKSELCPRQRAGDLHPVAGDRLARNAPGNSPSAASSALSPVHSPRIASPATTEATKVLVAATLFSAPARMSIAWSEAAASGEPAVLVMAMVSAPPSRAALGHRHDVRALARLRDGDAGRLRELQPGAIDRGDRRTERGDRHAGGELDRIFEEGRGMVRRAARDRGEEARIERADRGAGLQPVPSPAWSSSRAVASGISSISRRIWVSAI